MNAQVTSFTNVLFPTSGFLTGVMRVVDLFGVTDAYNDSPTAEEADAMALYADLVTVSNDLKAALEEYKNVYT